MSSRFSGQALIRVSDLIIIKMNEGKFNHEHLQCIKFIHLTNIIIRNHIREVINMNTFNSAANKKELLEALDQYKSSLEESPSNIHFACCTANLYARLEQYNKAFETLHNAQKLNEEDHWLTFRLAALYMETGDIVNALLLANTLWEKNIRTQGLKTLIAQAKEKGKTMAEEKFESAREKKSVTNIVLHKVPTRHLDSFLPVLV